MAKLKIDQPSIQKPQTEYEVENIKEILIAQKKVNILLSNLERLKSDLAATKTQYKILQADYADICDSAISRVITIKEMLNRQSREETRDLPATSTTMNNTEAMIKLGLAPPETNSKPANIKSENIKPKINGWQYIVDKAGSGIEFVLDKIGDSIILLFKMIFRLKVF